MSAEECALRITERIWLHSAQICSAIAPQTLHIPGTLGDIARRGDNK